MAQANEAGEARAVLIRVPEAEVVHPFWPGSVLSLMSHFFNWAIGDGSLLYRFPEHRYWSFPNLPETLLLIALPLWLIGLVHLRLWKIVGFLLADFLVDALNHDEYRHRCQLLQVDPTCEALERHWFFYFVSHMLANLYVVVLECGRLWGHLKRFQVIRGVFRRFDWHCGRLPKAPFNFRRREQYKFVFFLVILMSEFIKRTILACMGEECIMASLGEDWRLSDLDETNDL